MWTTFWPKISVRYLYYMKPVIYNSMNKQHLNVMFSQRLNFFVFYPTLSACFYVREWGLFSIIVKLLVFKCFPSQCFFELTIEVHKSNTVASVIYNIVPLRIHGILSVMKCCSKQCAVSQLREKITVIVAKIVQKTTDVVIYLDYEETESQKVPFRVRKTTKLALKWQQHANTKIKRVKKT